MKPLNIDRSVTDAFYRYQMPPIALKIEGRGNGIKTVLLNIKEVARSLGRDAKHLTKYLSLELGALSSIDEENSKYVINGAHDTEKVQKYIFKFIDELVLCKGCRNPETLLFCTSSRKLVHQKCIACGFEGAVKSSNKLIKGLLKELPGKESIAEEKNEGFEEFEDFEGNGYAFG
ncbi:translation initiation factor 5 [Nematocida displodere]|uniref:Translation initiation factor 5 n=1 Tax=Nematocida displodere TaxID=1805483 RepID=A0A177ECS4_9MICR|nr:translation initiation factor 5 [Nematocida displodere]